MDDEAKKHNQNLPGMGGVYNSFNLQLYHYAGNNPVKYVDPTGMWIDNEDGTYTAEEGDTLWGLQQKTGKDWKKSDYLGKPENLQIGQKVSFNNVFSNIDLCNSIIGNSAGALSSGFEQFGKAWYTTYSEIPNQFVYPLPTLADPDIMNKSRSFGRVSKTCLIIGIGYDFYDAIKTGINSESFLRGTYRLTGNLVSTVVGVKVSEGVTALCTVGSAGIASIPGVVAGVFCGAAASAFVDWGFRKGENLLWKK